MTASVIVPTADMTLETRHIRRQRGDRTTAGPQPEGHRNLPSISGRDSAFESGADSKRLPHVPKPLRAALKTRFSRLPAPPRPPPRPSVPSSKRTRKPFSPGALAAGYNADEIKRLRRSGHGRPRVAAPALTAAVRVIHWVHHNTADGRALALPAHPAGLAADPDVWLRGHATESALPGRKSLLQRDPSDHLHDPGTGEECRIPPRIGTWPSQGWNTAGYQFQRRAQRQGHPCSGTRRRR